MNAYRSLRLVEKQPLGLSYLFGSVIQHLILASGGPLPLSLQLNCLFLTQLLGLFHLLDMYFS